MAQKPQNVIEKLASVEGSIEKHIVEKQLRNESPFPADAFFSHLFKLSLGIFQNGYLEQAMERVAGVTAAGQKLSKVPKRWIEKTVGAGGRAGASKA